MNLQKLEADYQTPHEDEPRLGGFSVLLAVLMGVALFLAGWGAVVLSAGFGK